MYVYAGRVTAQLQPLMNDAYADPESQRGSNSGVCVFVIAGMTLKAVPLNYQPISEMSF